MAKIDIVEKYRETVNNKFRRLNVNDKELQSLGRKIKLGKGTQVDVAKFADRLGDNLEMALKDTLHLDGMPDKKLTRDFANAVIKPAMKNTLDNVNANAIMQLRFSDKKSGINVGIKAAKGERRMDNTINKMTQASTQEQLNSAISNVKTDARGYYDEFQMENAELRASLGFDEIIIRTYDDVGLHRNTKYSEPCHWCLDRAGTWDYAEARDAGVFNRHPGCGCKIEMITSNNTRMTQTKWWMDVDEKSGKKIKHTGNVWE